MNIQCHLSAPADDLFARQRVDWWVILRCPFLNIPTPTVVITFKLVARILRFAEPFIDEVVHEAKPHRGRSSI